MAGGEGAHTPPQRLVKRCHRTDSPQRPGGSAFFVASRLLLQRRASTRALQVKGKGTHTTPAGAPTLTALQLPNCSAVSQSPPASVVMSASRSLLCLTLLGLVLSAHASYSSLNGMLTATFNTVNARCPVLGVFPQPAPAAAAPPPAGAPVNFLQVITHPSLPLPSSALHTYRRVWLQVLE